MSATSFPDAYAYTCRVFPTLASLGTDAADWITAVQLREASAFDAVLATSMSVEGGNLGGLQNFDQRVMLRALHARRAALDATYTNPYLEPVPQQMAPKRTGFLVIA